MKSFEALSRVIGRHSAEQAQGMGLRIISIQKWKEDPARSGSINPLDRVEAMTRKAVELGRGPEAFEAIRYLCRQFGFYLVPMPQGRTEFSAVADGLFCALREQADFAAASAEALRDQEITPSERNLIEREAWEAQEAIAGFLRLVCDAEQVSH